MASIVFLIASMMVATMVASCLATEYTVGDDKGWSLNVNYTTWAQGKDFRVGDKIIFMYNKDNHNVGKVNGNDFNQCTTPTNVSNILTSGSDTITLSAPGKKWYICGVNDHCSRGMKLVINVAAADGTTPSAATNNISPVMWMLATLAALAWIMV